MAGLVLLENRMAAARQQMEDAQAAANQEEKSSAGDKYETARAMGQLQKDMFARQLAEHGKELTALRSVNVDQLYSTATTGAVLECEKLTFFIAAGLGKQLVGDRWVIFLSPRAPLARQLQQKKAGDDFVFNSLRTNIVSLF